MMRRLIGTRDEVRSTREGGPLSKREPGRKRAVDENRKKNNPKD